MEGSVDVGITVYKVKLFFCHTFLKKTEKKYLSLLFYYFVFFI